MNHDPLDELFHACALRAFIEQSHASGSWPCPESTRRLAYSLYEKALAEKNRARSIA
jgi:hypothetical protein